MNIELIPKTIFKVFLYLILLLLCLNVIGIISKFYFGYDRLFGLIHLFNFDTEKNIPTLYSTIALLLSSVLLSVIAITHKYNNTAYLSWAGLALIFLYLSIDEFVTIHEQFGPPARELLNASGILSRSAWLVPYSLLLILFLIYYSRFLINLPKKIRSLFLLSGSTFVAGAIGFELLGGWQAEINGKDNLFYSMLYTCEEFLEMLGIVIFIYTLLKYIQTEFKSLRISITENNR